jgi:hypothetical protein
MLQIDATPIESNKLRNKCGSKHANSRQEYVNLNNIKERGFILDTIYAHVFDKLKRQSNFDLVSDRNLINNGLDLDFKVDTTIGRNLNAYIKNLDNFINQLLVSTTTITNIQEEITNLKMNPVATLTATIALNDTQLITMFKNLGILTVGGSITPVMKENIKNYLSLFAVLSQYKTLASFSDITHEQIELLKQSLKQIITVLKSYRDIAAIAEVAEIIVNNLETVNTNSLSTEAIIPLKFKFNVEGIILDLEDKFYTNKTAMKNTILWGLCGVKPDFSIGLNYLYFGRNNSGQRDFTNQVVKRTNINYVGLASEKIGLKFMFFDRKYTHSFGQGEWFQYKGKRSYRKWLEPVSKNPIFTHGYVNAYFSGVLYNLVDLKTDKEFNYTFFGTGAGITLFNNLDVNFSVAWLMKKSFMTLDKNNMFYSVSFDIPIFEYLKAIKK